jgi:hypothetical protein
MLFRCGFLCRRRFSGRYGMQKSICNRHRCLLRWTSTRRALVVHHLLEAAVFKQHMLPGAQLIRRFAKLIRHIQHRSLRPAIVNTRIAVPRHPKLEIERPIAA